MLTSLHSFLRCSDGMTFLTKACVFLLFSFCLVSSYPAGARDKQDKELVQKKTVLSSPPSSSALLPPSSSPAAPSAKAENKALLPLAEWDVQAFPAEKDGVEGFCTLYRPYEGGVNFFLSLNRTAAAKVLFDLPASLGKTALPQDAVFSIGGAYARLFEGKQIVDQSIDFSFDAGGPLLNAIPGARTLSVSLGDTKLLLDIEGMGSSVRKLLACAKGEGPLSLVPASLAAPNPLPMPRPAEGEKPSKASLSLSEKKDLVPSSAPVDEALSTNIPLFPLDEKEEQTSSAEQEPEGQKEEPVLSPKEVSLANVPVETLSLSERELLENMKRKLMILEKEKEALRAELSAYREEKGEPIGGIFVPQVPLPSREDMKRVEHKITALEEELKKERDRNVTLSAQCAEIEKLAVSLDEKGEEVLSSPPKP